MKWLFLFLALFLSVPIQASQRVFDGYFHPGYFGAIPVWMELQIPDADGPVTGTYFYKKKGIPLQLEGMRKGDSIRLSESEKKGKVTGMFTLAFKPDSLAGTWQSSKRKKDEMPSRVVFFPAAPEDKKYATFPKPTELKLLSGKTLAQEMKERAEEADDGEGGRIPLPTVEFLSYSRNIASISIGGEFTGGAYSTSWTSRFNIDLESKQEFDIQAEIDPSKLKAFNKLLHDKFKVELANSRQLISDSEWTDAFGSQLEEITEETPDPLAVCFNIETYNRCSSGGGEQFAVFTPHGLLEVMNSVYGFPHVIQALDLYLDVRLTWKELGKFLKKDSRLQPIVQRAR